MKDPAILFYTSDFLTGTMTMTNEEVGKYIRLLCLQHQKKRLTEKDMLYICNTYVEEVYSKFVKDENGLYYNERLEQESIKRKNYSESRRKNISKRYEPTYVEHMENENINENVNINKNDKEERSKTKRFTPPSLEDVTGYIKEKNYSINPDVFMNFYLSNGWMVGKNKMKDWRAAIRNWQIKENGNGSSQGKHLDKF